MIEMHDCPFCDKKMPKHILEKHLVKSHSGKEVATSTPEPEKFDWGEVKECGMCHQEFPQKFMNIHVRIEHGI